MTPLLTLHEAGESDSGEQWVSLSVVVGDYEYRLAIASGTFGVPGTERDWKPLHEVTLDRDRDGVSANLHYSKAAL